ncbi:hypothetical protein [Pseudomonas sp. NPDC087615]|uniref:hypothetical protein n=1 Tax=Pseudomonas sp. NPDC087615 TaxID=3364443 RepID=UPI0037F7D83F
MIESSTRKRDVGTITAAVNDALHHLPGDNRFCLMLIGSWSLNLGTPTSDIDLLLVSDERMTGTESLQAFQRQIALSLSWVQIENVSREEFGRLVAKAQLPSYQSLSSRTLELIYKYTNSHVLHGNDVFRELTEAFSLEDFSVKIADYYMSRSMNVYQDVLGARLTEDHRSAVVAVRELVGLAVDALLALRGDAYPKAKWRLKRATRLQLAPSLMAAIDRCLVGGPTGELADHWQWIENALMLFRQLHFLTVYPGGATLPFPGLDATVAGNPWAFVLRANGKWLITHQDRFFEANEQSITVLFALAMALPPAQVINVVGNNAVPNHGDSTTSVDTSLQLLEKLGAL